ncbi:hypothetical protein Moror_3814 [Moniliophthora roreri MCA 2997]|uniref:Uncharacterized protein n=2 Tax=Moniliophthora roreri TaxID=221103 RepID=V2XR90_MONRO|nr:hypothetical protein Moror_3814 [Moniliophthora roreri MCA 2997]KAI3611396.1 hypothetical protein WG66_002120 [Moniliophthora roreri]
MPEILDKLKSATLRDALREIGYENWSKANKQEMIAALKAAVGVDSHASKKTGRSTTRSPKKNEADAGKPLLTPVVEIQRRVRSTKRKTMEEETNVVEDEADKEKEDSIPGGSSSQSPKRRKEQRPRPTPIVEIPKRPGRTTRRRQTKDASPSKPSTSAFKPKASYPLRQKRPAITRTGDAPIATPSLSRSNSDSDSDSEVDAHPQPVDPLPKPPVPGRANKRKHVSSPLEPSTSTQKPISFGRKGLTKGRTLKTYTSREAREKRRSATASEAEASDMDDVLPEDVEEHNSLFTEADSEAHDQEEEEVGKKTRRKKMAMSHVEIQVFHRHEHHHYVHN